MRFIKFYITAILISGLLFSCGKNSQKTSENQNNSAGEVISISTPTVQCSMCKKNIQNALKNQPGIVKTTVDIKNHKVDVEIDKSLTSAGNVEQLISKAGYDANGMKADSVAYQNLDDCCKLPKDQKEPGHSH